MLLTLMLTASLAAGAATEVSAASSPTVIYLIRHAEKLPEPKDDPLLTDAGAARAQALTDILGEAGIEAIITSDRKRTQLTAAPLAAKLKLNPEVVTLAADLDAHVKAVAASILEHHQGQTILVVSHDGVLQPLSQALGAPTAFSLTSTEYSKLFVMVRPVDGPVRVALLHYGACDTPKAAPPP